MADSSQKQDVGDVDASAAQIAQARRDANLIQNSPNTTIDNRRSLFSWGARPPKTIDWGVATRLLERQAIDVENRLEQMLFGIAEVGLTPSPQEVAKLAATKILTIEQANPEIIDPMRPILEVYDRPSIKGSLLILGTPGAGKTTTLLSLAQELIGRELVNIQQGSPKAVIPLIFELSTWRDDRQSIGDWLVAQLYENYGGDREIYKLWLEQQVLLPLLDGLDELGLVRQQKCTEQLNQFAQTYPQMVVCCRVKEFRQVGVKLSNLRGAVQLEPLSDRQIQAYLAAVGKSALWEQIQTVPEMHNLLQPVVDPDYDEPGLLRVPLFISLVARVFEADRPLSGKADLFDRYIDRQLSYDMRVSARRKEVQKRDWAFKTVEREPDRREVRRFLTWVAKQLKNNNQTDFLIEKIQPTLSFLTPTQRCLYSTLFGIAISILTGLEGLLTGGVLGLDFGLKAALFSALPLGLIGGFISLFIKKTIPLAESLKWSWHSAKTNIPHELMVGMLVGLTIGLGGEVLIAIIYGFYGSIIQMIFDGLLNSLSYGLSCGLMIFMLHGLTGSELILKKEPNQGIWQAYKNATLLLLIVSITFGAIAYFVFNVEHLGSITLGLNAGIAVAFIGGADSSIRHFILRLILWSSGCIPWNYSRFLTYCHERRLLQQIGGRYRFIHRELLDHFARIEN
jgi:DNA polymerase III delta prime subunit